MTLEGKVAFITGVAGADDVQSAQLEGSPRWA